MNKLSVAGAVARRPVLVLCLAALTVVVLVLAATLRLTPPVAVNLAFTERAAARLAGRGHPVCLRLIIADPTRPADSNAVGLRAERRCSFEPGVVRFRAHPYLRNPFEPRSREAHIDIRATAFSKTAARGDYDCGEIVQPASARPPAVLTMRCDLL